MSSIQSEILEMLAKERGLPAARIQLSSRLLQDLGMDGDDAVDFFISIRERFDTNLAELQSRWSEHFGPEGMSLWNAVIVIPIAALGGVGAAFLHLSKGWAIGFVIALFVVWIGAMRRWGLADKMVAITVADVIAAVELGVWPTP